MGYVCLLPKFCLFYVKFCLFFVFTCIMFQITFIFFIEGKLPDVTIIKKIILF